MSVSVIVGNEIEPGAVRPTAGGRMLSVLDAFDADHILLSLTEISRRAGLNLSTAHRLVGELRQWGALDRTRDGRYSVGLRILELGSLAPQGLHLRDVALPHLGDLQHAIHANVHLAVRDGHDVVYVESLQARDGARVLSRLGGRWPMHATGTGQVLLAFAPPEFREEVLSSKLRRFTPQTLSDPDDLRKALAEVRQTGVAIAEDQLTTDAVALAVPLRGQRDRIVAALGVTVKKDVSPQAVVPALTATARGISRALGAPSAMTPVGAEPGPTSPRQ
jgi:DNA-binding IclR family transcriptional regulator